MYIILERNEKQMEINSSNPLNSSIIRKTFSKCNNRLSPLGTQLSAIYFC